MILGGGGGAPFYIIMNIVVANFFFFGGGLGGCTSYNLGDAPPSPCITTSSLTSHLLWYGNF